MKAQRSLDSKQKKQRLTHAHSPRPRVLALKRSTRRSLRLTLGILVSISMLLGSVQSAPTITSAQVGAAPAGGNPLSVDGLAGTTSRNQPASLTSSAGTALQTRDAARPITYTIGSPTPAPTLTPIPDTNYEDQALDRKRDALLARANALPAAAPDPAGVSINGKNGGKVRSQDGGLTVALLPGVVPDRESLNVQVTRVKPQKGDPRATRNGRNLPLIYDLTATRGRGGPKVERFNNEAALIWDLGNAELAAAGISGLLTVYTFNEVSKVWERVPTMWSPQTNQLIALTPHFSSYTVDNVFESVKNYLPSVGNFEVDLQSGTASVQHPIDLPPGPGGFGPHVSLSYNSGNIDRVDVTQQGPSSVGWGWTLSTSYIAATQHHYPEGSNCDAAQQGYHPWTASIVADGIQGDLVKGTDGYWHSSSESFARIQYIAGTNTLTGTVRTTDSWVAWGRDGTKYEFNLQALTRDEVNRNGGYCSGTTPLTTYRWMLHRATDARGNVITYSYKYQDGNNQLQASPITGNKTRAVYPYQISYGVGGDQVQVNFNIVPRQDVTGTVDISLNDINSDYYQSHRIDRIEVRRKQQTMPQPLPAGCNSTSGYCLLRAYNLSQNYETVLLGNDVNRTEYRHLTLKAITPIGSDNITQLPSTTFDYIQRNCCSLDDGFVEQDWGHLWFARNGYGGAVGFHYDAAGGDVSKWYRRVRAKRMQDGFGLAPPLGSTPHEAKYFYDYRGPQVNETHISDEVQGSKPLHMPGKEFRGFSWVREQDPSGQMTDHYYYQDDTFKTREWRTQVGKAEMFSDTMNAFPPGSAWTTAGPAGSVVGSTDPLAATNGVWRVSQGGSFSHRLVETFTQQPTDGYDVAQRFMIRQIDTDPNNDLRFTGTWKVENANGNGEYWGVQITRKYSNSAGSYQLHAKVVWSVLVNGVLTPGTRDISNISNGLRPYRPVPFPVDTWYSVRLHTSPDGRFAVELHRDNYIEDHPRPDSRPSLYSDHIMIKSSDLADGGGTIPLFPLRQDWRFKHEVTDGGTTYVSLADAYSEQRTVYSQLDSYYQDQTPVGPATAQIGNAYALVAQSNNTEGMNIRFVPLVKTEETLYSSTGPQRHVRTKKTYAFDSYGNQTGLDEYMDNSSVVRSTRMTFAANTSLWIVDKIARSRVYHGVAELATSKRMAETLYFYDNEALFGTIPNSGKANLTEVRQIGLLNGTENGQTSSQRFEYDLYGNPTKVYDPNNNATTVTYDSYYKTFPVQTTYANGRSEIVGYDFTKDVSTSRTDVNNTVSGMAYDVFGRPTKTWVTGFGDSDHPNEEYVYPDLGQPSLTPPFYISYRRTLGVTAGPNNTTWQTRWFDGRGRPIEDVSPRDGANSIVVNYTYTNNSQLETTTRPYSVANSNPLSYIQPDTTKPKTTNLYDGLDRLVQVVHADNTSLTYDYTWVKEIGLRDETGREKWQEYDVFGRLVWNEERNTAVTPIVVVYTHYQYDVLNRPTFLFRDRDGPNQKQTLFYYDGLGRRSRIADPDTGTWDYEYDAAGNLIQQRDQLYLADSVANANHQIFMEYDAMNRLKAKYFGAAHYSNNPLVRIPDVRYYYDNDLNDAATKFSWGKLRNIEVTVQGQGTSKANGHGYEYDTRGGLVAEVVTTTYSTREYRTAYAYDTGGRQQSVTYPDPETTQEQVTSHYNEYAGGLPDKLSTNKSSVWPVYNATYNERGQLLTLDQGSNSITTDHLLTSYTYDDASTKRGWLTRTRVTSNSGNTVHLDLNTTHTAAGNITTIQQTAGSVSDPANPTFTNTYAYDGLNRLTSASSTNTSIFPSETYSFDTLGRMTTRTIGGTSYSYTYGDPAHVDAPTAYKGNTYTYDAAGNQLTRTTPASSTQTRTFDSENQLVKTVEGATTTEYIYDGSGQRIIKSVATTATLASKTALLVVGDPALNASETAIRIRLQGLGYTVTVVDDSVVTSADATGKTVVFISSTVVSGSVNTKLRNVGVPVINSEPLLMDDMGMTGTAGTEYANNGGQTQLKIVDPAHPLAGGLFGTVTVSTAATDFTWGKPNSNAAKIATFATDSTRASVFGYVSGAQMPGLAAPARRVGFFDYDGTAALHTTAGWALFDAAVNWATASVSVQRTLYVGNLYEEELTGSNSTGAARAFTSYYYLGAQPLGMRRVNYAADNGQFRVATDHLGSTTLIFDTSSPPAVVHRQYYKPYGEVAWQAGSSKTNIGYTGQRLDNENGLMYYGARYYDPVLSYFVSPDSLVPDPARSQSLNRYAYVSNNPVGNVDPSGYCEFRKNEQGQEYFADPEKLDCTMDDFDRMTAHQRILWLQAFSSKNGYGDTFQSIMGVIAWFGGSDTINFNPGSWTSLADAGVLFAIQAGQRLREGKPLLPYPVPQGMSPEEARALRELYVSAARAWSNFFGEYKASGGNWDANGNRLLRLYGQAEQAGETFGADYASARTPFPTGVEGALLAAFIAGGNGVRAAQMNGDFGPPIYTPTGGLGWPFQRPFDPRNGMLTYSLLVNFERAFVAAYYLLTHPPIFPHPLPPR